MAFRNRPRYQDMVDEMRTGNCAGVFIDDSGSPGLIETPPHLHPDRKSWVAVVVPRASIAEVCRELPGAIHELQRATGATEFHFSDIYGGNREFKGVDPDTRISLFEFFASLFETYAFPILVQTLDPSIVCRVRDLGLDLPNTRPFDFANHEHIALFFLLVRVRDFVRDGLPGESARVFVDEGFQSSGVGLRLPSLQPEFRDGLVCFAESSSILPLQLADFAAFGLNRVQLIRGKDVLSRADRRLLEIYTALAENYVNIEHREVDFESWRPILVDDDTSPEQA